MDDPHAVRPMLSLPDWLPAPHSMAVTAGAGTGKTTALVERYMFLIEQSVEAHLAAPQLTRKPSLSRGVAITFTRKAAREMRDRVRQRLQVRRDVDDSARRMLWNDLLNEIDAARIQTIDALQADILRANAAAAKVSPRFQVLDDMGQRLLLDDAITDALQTVSAQAGHPGMPVIRAYEAYQIRDALKVGSLMASAMPEMSGDLMAEWRQAWWLAAQDWQREFAANPDISTVLYERSDNPKFEDYHAPFRTYAQTLIDAADPDTFRVALASLAGLSRAGKATIGGASAAPLREAIKSIHEFGRTGVSLPYPDDLPDGRAAELIPAWLALINVTQAKFADLKRRQNVMDFADVAAAAHRLLTQHPQIADRYQPPNGEFDFVLVDEFQDTDQNQWETIRQLAPPEQPGALFIVGDPKQSIYGFRGADVRVFNIARHEVALHGQSVDLSLSYRTNSTLIGKFNTMFAQIMQAPVTDVWDRSVYADHAPLEALASAQHPDPQRPILMAIMGNGDNAEEMLEREALGLAQQIETMVREGWLMRDRATQSIRPVQYGDFAVLMRALTRVDTFEQAFRARGVPYLTVGSRTYFNRREIGDLIALLSALDVTDDDLNLAAALHSPLFGLSDTALLALRRRPEPTLWEQLTAAVQESDESIPTAEMEAVKFAATLLNDLRERVGRLTIAQVLSEIVEKTGIAATLARLPNGAQARVNIEKLIGLAHSSGHVTVPAFARFAQEMRAGSLHESDAVLDAEGRVQLMTIHASKGLEFPVMCLADIRDKHGRPDPLLITADQRIACMLPAHERITTENGKSQNHGFAWKQIKHIKDEREDAESQRMLYVALTRARDYVIVSGAQPSDKQVASSKSWLTKILNSGQVDLEIPVSVGALVDYSEPPHTARESIPDYSRPILLDRIAGSRRDISRHITATTLAHLGHAQSATDSSARTAARERARKSLLGDQRGPMHRVSAGQRPSARVIGEIVHTVLQYGYDTLHPDEREPLLRGLIWDAGLSEPAAQESAWIACEKLLSRMEHLPLTAQIRRARTVLREVPFMLAREGQIIHGIIDLLFRDAANHWVLVDYKTDFIPQGQHHNLKPFAAEYHLQMALYAQAAYERLGVTPRVVVCFLSAGSVEVAPELLDAALERALLPQIRDLLASDADLHQ